MNGTITIHHTHDHGHESIETNRDGFYQGTRFDVFRSRNEVWIANGKQHCDRGIVRGSWRAQVESRYEGDPGYSIPFETRWGELLPGACEVVFVGGIKYRPNVPEAFLNWWGVDDVHQDDLEGVGFPALEAINSLGPADDLRDAGAGGSARVVPRVSAMAAAMLLLERWDATPSYDQLHECERWIRAEGRRTCHWYTATGEPFHVEQMGSEKVVQYRAASRNPWTGERAVPADHEPSKGGLLVNAPDYAHLSTQLAEVAALTGSPSALRFMADIVDCAFASLGPGNRMARVYGYLWLGAAKVAGVSRPFFPELAARMDRYVAASLPHAEKAQKHVPAGADPELDPSFTIPVAAPGWKGDHIAPTDAMEEMRDHYMPDVTDQELVEMCESCSDWQAGIYLTGLMAADALCSLSDDARVSLLELEGDADRFLHRCFMPAVEHRTMKRSPGKAQGWNADIGGGTIPGTTQGVTFSRDYNDGHEQGVARRFVVPACEEVGLHDGSAALAEYLIAEDKWGGGTMLATYLGPWIKRAARKGIGQ